MKKISIRTQAAGLTVLAASLLAGCFGKSPQEDLAAAQASVGKGERNAAIIQAKSALQKDPNMAEARVLLARMLYETGDLSAAAIELDKVAKVAGQDDLVAPLQARLLQARGKNAEVIEKFSEKKLGKQDAQVDLLSTLAIAYAAEGKVDQAMKTVSDALALDSSNRRAFLVRVRVLRAKEGVEAATKEIDSYLARQTKDNEAWQIKGELAAAAGNKEEAISAYRQSVLVRRANLVSQAALISLLLEKKDLTAAAAQVNEMRAAAPRNPQTEFLAAALALERNEIKEAHERIQRVLKVAGNDPRVLQLAANIDVRRGALFEADAKLGKVLLAVPDNASARLMQSRVQLKLGDATKAETLLQPLLDVPKPTAEVLSLAAEIQTSQGDRKEADEYLVKLSKLKPDDVRVRVALANSAIRSGKVDQGVAQLRAIAAKDPAVYAEMALVNFYVQRRDYPQALAVIDGMDKKFPGRPGVIGLRGRVDLMRGEPEKALQDFEQALKIDPQYYPAVVAASGLDIAAGRLGPARTRLQAFVKSNPKHLPAQMALVDLVDREGGSQADIAKALRAVIAQLPSEVEPRLRLINQQLKLGDKKAALAAAQEATAALPDNPETWAALGRVQAAMGSTDQAIVAFNKIINLSPSQPQSYMPLADLYVTQKDLGSAQRTIKRALEMRPDFFPAQMALIQIAVSSNKKADALAVARQIQQQHPQQAAGLMLAGDIEMAFKSPDLALQNYRAALANGGGSEVAIKVGNTLRAARRDPEAAKFEADWLASHPDDTDFLVHLGSLAITRNELASAEERFRAVVKRNPDHAIALNDLAWVLSKQNKPGALELAERANALTPGQHAFLDTLAAIYAQTGQAAKAVATEKKAVELAPDGYGYRLSLARYYVAAGQKEAARDELKRLAELGSKLPQQSEVQKLLGTL